MEGLTGEAPFSTLWAVASGDYEGKKYVITNYYRLSGSEAATAIFVAFVTKSITNDLE
jgi:hypothetical protein